MNPGGDGNQIRIIQQDQTQLLRIDGSEVPVIHESSHPGGPLHQQDTMAVHLPGQVCQQTRQVTTCGQSLNQENDAKSVLIVVIAKF